MMDIEALRGIDHGQHQLLAISSASAAGTYDHRFNIGNGELQRVLDAQRSGGDDVGWYVVSSWTIVIQGLAYISHFSKLTINSPQRTAKNILKSVPASTYSVLFV